MHEGVSHGNLITAVHGEGYVTFCCLCRNGKRNLAVCECKFHAGCTGQAYARDEIETGAADSQDFTGLDGLGSCRKSGRYHQGDGAGLEALAGKTDGVHVAALCRCRQTERESLVICRNGEIRHFGAALENDLFDHVQVGALDGQGLAGLRSGDFKAADSRVTDNQISLGIALVGDSIGILRFVGISKYDLAGNRLGGHHYLEALAGLFGDGVAGSDDSIRKDDFLDQVHIVSRNGDDVTGHCALGSKVGELDGLGVSELGKTGKSLSVLTYD